MPRASKRPVNKNVLLELEDNFAFLISSLSSGKDIQHFFETFLTKEEKIMLTKRLMLHLMIENGYDPSEISSVLSLSRETVYKHVLILQFGGNIYKGIIAKITKRKKLQTIWKTIEKILRPIDLILQAQNDMKARAKVASGDFS